MYKCVKFILKTINFNLNYFLEKALIRSFILSGHESIVLTLSEYLTTCLIFFKTNLMQNQKTILDIVVVDLPEKTYRFRFLYIIYNPFTSNFLYVWTSTNELKMMYSLQKLFNSSVWIEREIWDLFGIYFLNNNDLRKLITDYGYKQSPLKKTFPVGGFHHVQYTNINKKLVSVHTKYSQSYRRML